MKIFFAFTAILLCSLAASNTFAQEVSGSIGNGTARRGAQTRGTIVLSIPSELHVNSNKPKSEYSIPTTVRVSGSGVKVSPVSFPRGTDRKFQFSERLINVYEGTVFFPFTLTVPGNYRGKSITVRAIVRYQACTNEVCYPPRIKRLNIKARIH